MDSDDSDTDWATTLQLIPSGNLTEPLKMVIEIVDLPIKHGGSFQFAFCMFTRPGKRFICKERRQLLVIFQGGRSADLIKVSHRSWVAELMWLVCMVEIDRGNPRFPHVLPNSCDFLR